MLLGLHFKPEDSREYKEDLGIRLANLVGKRTRVFESRNHEEYSETIKAYKPNGRDNLVLINTHYDLGQSDSLGHWRALDITVAQKGGVVFGEQPSREAITYQQPIKEDSLDHMVLTATHYANRASTLKKEAPGYVGRSDSDPHTLVFGYVPTWPRLALTAEAFLAGLPDEWWMGVGYYSKRTGGGKSVDEFYAKAVDKFYYSSYITVTDLAHEVLTRLDVPHEIAPRIDARTLPAAKKYGLNLRKISRLDAERVVE
jgi:hypothetical protein